MADVELGTVSDSVSQSEVSVSVSPDRPDPLKVTVMATAHSHKTDGEEEHDGEDRGRASYLPTQEVVQVRRQTREVEMAHHEKKQQEVKIVQQHLQRRSANCLRRRFYCADATRQHIVHFFNDPDSSTAAWYYNILFIVVWALAYIASVMETLRDTRVTGDPYYRGNFSPRDYLLAQYVFLSIFGLDLLVRFVVADVWCCRRRGKCARGCTQCSSDLDTIQQIRSRGIAAPELKVLEEMDSATPFFRDIYNWIDVISILGGLLGTASFFVALRIFRLIKNVAQFRIIMQTMRDSFRLLAISTFFLISMLIFLAALLLSLESCYNKDCVFPDAWSTMYFLLITMTSVGYGDQVPNTAAARALAVLVMLVGALYLAMPLAIIGAKFDNAWANHLKQVEEKLTASQRRQSHIRRNRQMVRSQGPQVTPAVRQRILVYSFQVADAINSCKAHIRRMASETASSKKALQISLERLFSRAGQFSLEILRVFPCHVPRWRRNALSNESTFGIIAETIGQADSVDKNTSTSVNDGNSGNTAGIGDSGGGNGAAPESKDDQSSSDGACKDEDAAEDQIAFEKPEPTSLDDDDGLENPHNNSPETVVRRIARRRLSVSRHVDMQKLNQVTQSLQFRSRSRMASLAHMTSSDSITTDPEHGWDEADTDRGDSLPTFSVTHDGLRLKGHFWEDETYRRMRNLKRRRTQTAILQGKEGRIAKYRFQCASCWDAMCINSERERREFNYNIRRAQAEGGCLNRMWLILEAPTSSPAAFWARVARMSLTLVSLILLFAETQPILNDYGETKRQCKAVVNYYCKWMSTCVADGTCNALIGQQAFTQEEVDSFNLACLPNSTLGYGGCMGTYPSSDYAGCDFPRPDLGFSCDNSTTIFGETWLNSIGRTTGFSTKHVCHRRQCFSSADDPTIVEGGLTETFFAGELVMILLFSVELGLRILAQMAEAAPPMSTWFLRWTHWVDIAALIVGCAELIGASAEYGKSEYSVFGWFGNIDIADPSQFRAIRIVVAIRFMIQLRLFDDTEIITTTVARTWKRLAVPILFFFVLASNLGGLLYMVEGGSMYTCSDWSAPTRHDGNCRLCLGPPFDNNFMLNPIMYEAGRADRIIQMDFGDQWLGHPEWYNGTCRFLHLSAQDGAGSVRVYQRPLVIDAFDGIWTIITTMTTVGYGAKYPRTSEGKIVVIIAAILGAFYLAMPLSIIATEFYKNFEARENENKKRAVQQHRDKVLQTGRLKLRHIVKLKLWAKRAVMRAKGHYHAMPPASLIKLYHKALHDLAREHHYENLDYFHHIHAELLDKVVTQVSRHMSTHIVYTRGAVYQPNHS